ncbi:ArsC family reductase [Pseudomaricurvus sp. HS19]|uniref:ArsC family reductase n=1 Tax=Pseudomaricurvus sp. HS19 TaxID=2692626 RepID=UPI00136E937F|nr:ArsC family reductase [Pseudomaricurvus sp. HS19]MYM63200.1 ArsC family reductase [Pseudomaricurvus sp. HS19]
MTTLYGISNCDTVKKARQWLEQNGIDYRFHDFRKDGLDQARVQGWVEQLGWETLVNKRSTTWKELDDASKAGLNADTAAALVTANPTLIKRPLLEHDNHTGVGFKAADYDAIFG